MCSFYLSAAARTAVLTDPSQRYSSTLLGLLTSKWQQVNGQQTFSQPTGRRETDEAKEKAIKRSRETQLVVFFKENCTRSGRTADLLSTLPSVRSPPLPHLSLSLSLPPPPLLPLRHRPHTFPLRSLFLSVPTPQTASSFLNTLTTLVSRPAKFRSGQRRFSCVFTRSVCPAAFDPAQ